MRSIIKFIRLLCIMLFLSLSFYDGKIIGQSLSPSDSLLKKKQEEFLKWKYGMFLHFNMATFVDKEWANGHEDPLIFNPSGLDCEQWASVIKSAGMKYAVLTVKHTCGWCLWDSKYTSHDITAFKNYKNGQGDIVKEYVNACRKNDIKVGLYYCLPGDYSNSYGDKLEPGLKDFHGLPPEAEGDFEGFVEKQITELLTNYGPIDLLWFDQFGNKYTGGSWLQLKALVYKLQPNCIVIANNSDNYQYTDIIGYEYPYLKQYHPDKSTPALGNKNASELCDCIDSEGKWFWHSGKRQVKNADEISNMIKLCNSRNTNYLLDVPPGRDGLIEELYVKQLMEIKKSLPLK